MKRFCVKPSFLDHGRRQRGAAARPPWIFKYDTNKVEVGLIVLFFGLVFSVGPPLEIFLPTPLYLTAKINTLA